MQSSCLGILHADSPMILVPMIKWFRVRNPSGIPALISQIKPTDPGFA